MNIASSKSGIKYIHVKPNSITNALDIYGPYLLVVRGKQVRNQPTRVETGTEHIPNDFHWLEQFVTLTDDVMFLNGVAFLTTLSSKIILVTS